MLQAVALGVLLREKADDRLGDGHAPNPSLKSEVRSLKSVALLLAVLVRPWRSNRLHRPSPSVVRAEQAAEVGGAVAGIGQRVLGRPRRAEAYVLPEDV